MTENGGREGRKEARYESFGNIARMIYRLQCFCDCLMQNVLERARVNEAQQSALSETTSARAKPCSVIFTWKHAKPSLSHSYNRLAMAFRG